MTMYVIYMNVHRNCKRLHTVKPRIGFEQKILNRYGAEAAMGKAKTQPVSTPTGDYNKPEQRNGQPQPLSGSKKVKNQNHSRQNHGEGS
jgi:small acid-soluble spore protein P (minor)